MGKLSVEVMTWTEEFVNDFNIKEKYGVTNIIIPCLSKVGQNIFSQDNETFFKWLV